MAYLELRVEVAGKLADEALGEGSAAQLLGYLPDLPGGDTFDVHLHKRQNQGLLVSLVAGKELGGVRGDESELNGEPRCPLAPSCSSGPAATLSAGR